MPSMFKNKNLAVLFFTLVVVMLGFGIVIPILPFYVERFGGSGSDMGMLMAIYSVMQFVFSPIWGSLSDRYGRKPILLAGILGNVASQVFYGLVGDLANAGMVAPQTALFLLIAARGLAGILSSATLPTAMAIIGDSTSSRERGGGMGLVGAAMGVGMALGPGVGGMMSNVSLSAPFYFAAAVSIAALLLTWGLVSESLPKEKRGETSSKPRRLQMKDMRNALFGPTGFLFFLAFLHSFALANFEGVFGMYTQLRYDYSAAQVGVVLTVVGLVSALAQGALTGPATRKWGDSFVVKASLFASVFGFLLMVSAKSEPGKIAAPVMSSAGFFMLANSMIRPGVSALISKRGGENQGSAMGMNNAFMSLGRIIGPLWAGYALDWNLNYPYLTGALLMGLGFALCFFFLPPENAEN
ncbi:MAG: MFS transporter [Chloroflexi bacterium]|nr:MFS transporter [Chloroflexota bacterium]